jgi:hypothetical protein
MSLADALGVAGLVTFGLLLFAVWLGEWRS